MHVGQTVTIAGNRTYKSEHPRNGKTSHSIASSNKRIVLNCLIIWAFVQALSVAYDYLYGKDQPENLRGKSNDIPKNDIPKRELSQLNFTGLHPEGFPLLTLDVKDNFIHDTYHFLTPQLNVLCTGVRLRPEGGWIASQCQVDFLENDAFNRSVFRHCLLNHKNEYWAQNGDLTFAHNRTDSFEHWKYIPRLGLTKSKRKAQNYGDSLILHQSYSKRNSVWESSVTTVMKSLQAVGHNTSLYAQCLKYYGPSVDMQYEGGNALYVDECVDHNQQIVRWHGPFNMTRMPILPSGDGLYFSKTEVVSSPKERGAFEFIGCNEVGAFVGIQKNGTQVLIEES